jgi:hypothetical protein
MATSFARDIKPLFRPIDVDHMSPYGVELDDYAYMSDAADDHRNARAVLEYLTGEQTPQMPPGGPYWDRAALELYGRWMADGYPP